MRDQIAEWVESRIGTNVLGVEPVAVGFGDTELWRVRRSSGVGDLLFRRFDRGTESTARREMLAMQAAHASGVPVPEVLACDDIDGRPVLITTWCDGETASVASAASLASAGPIGTLLGETLGRIHRVPAPAGLSPPDAWITKGGLALRGLRARLEHVPNADRLVHLDFHPMNVMVSPGKVEGVIDWTNTLAGPPYMDLARSRAILRVIAERGSLPPGFLDAVRHCEAAMVEAHTQIAGPDPHPALSAAWGMAMTVDDLVPHLSKPQDWLTSDLLDRLRRIRDDLIATALNAPV